MTTDLLQWLGFASGALGAALLAWPSRVSGWGFVAYLFSNACWFGFGILTSAHALVAMQCVFTATSSVGIWRWLVAPRRQRQLVAA